MKIKILKAKAINPVTKAIGYVARVVTNGTATFEDLCEAASRNTTLHKSEVRTGFELGLEEAALQLKKGFIVDLGPIGKIYPSCSSGWVKAEEELSLENIKTHVYYKPSQEINSSILSASLSWSKQTVDETQTGTSGSGSSSGSDAGGSGSSSGGDYRE